MKLLPLSFTWHRRLTVTAVRAARTANVMTIDTESEISKYALGITSTERPVRIRNTKSEIRMLWAFEAFIVTASITLRSAEKKR